MQLNKFIVYFNIFKIVGLGTFCLPLTMAIEDEFGIEIPDVEAIELKTVNDVVNYVKQK